MNALPTRPPSYATDDPHTQNQLGGPGWAQRPGNYRGPRVRPRAVVREAIDRPRSQYLPGYFPGNERPSGRGLDRGRGTDPQPDVPPGEVPLVGEAPAAEPPRPRSASPDHMVLQPQVEIQVQVDQPDPEPEALAHLHHFYYKLYSKYHGGPMASMNPVDASRPELSLFCVEHIGPPCLWQQVLDHICVREQLDTNGAKLFSREQRLDMEAPLFSAFNWQEGRCGSRENPLQLRARMRDVEIRGQNEQRNFTGLIEDLQGAIAANLERDVWTRGNVFFAERNAIANGQSVHYRLYWPNGNVPMSSRAPLHLADPSLSRLSNENVSPPRLTEQYKDHISHIEGIHVSRLKFYRLATQPLPGSIFGGVTEIPKDSPIFVNLGAERAFSEIDPLLVCVDVDRLPETGEPDREVAACTLPLGTRVGRGAAKTSVFVGEGIWAMLVYLAKAAYRSITRRLSRRAP